MNCPKCGHTVAETAVVEKLLSVVGREDDQRVVPEPTLLKLLLFKEGVPCILHGHELARTGAL